jgi:LysR substrate binding domain
MDFSVSDPETSVREHALPHTHSTALQPLGHHLTAQLTPPRTWPPDAMAPTLSSAQSGILRFAGNEHIVAGLIATAFGQLRQQYPGIAMGAASVVMSEQERVLRERRVDLVLGGISQSIEEDISTQILVHDRIMVMAG